MSSLTGTTSSTNTGTTTGSSTGTINITGLASGIDSSSIIAALVATEQEPITHLQDEEAVLKQQQGVFTTLQSQVQTLATDADNLESLANIYAKKATSSNGAVTVAASGSAQTGSFDVDVQNVASSFKTYSNDVSAHDQGGVFGTGTITIQDGSGSPIAINVDSSTTLDDLASEIQQSDSNLTAAVVYDGSGYRLQVASTQTGTANAVNITEAGTTLGLGDADNIRSQGQDAKFTVDGIPMTRPTNTVDDALQGITMQLNSATTTTGDATVSIGADTDTIKASINKLVSDYNAIVGTINTQTTWTGTADPTKLTGDQTLLGLQRQLASIIGQGSASSSAFANLSAIGIATQTDGTLTVDDTKLSAALSSNPEGVAQMIADNPSTGTQGLAHAIADVAHGYGDAASGLIQTRVDGISDETQEMDTEITQMQENVTAYQTQLQTKYANLESVVSQWKNYASSITSAIGQSSSK